MKSSASEPGLTLTSSANCNIRRVLSRDCQEEKKGKDGVIRKIHCKFADKIRGFKKLLASSNIG